jgi:hypothetical protein
MNTLQKIQDHAAEIMARGGPVGKDEIDIVKMATPSKGKAFNAGKRNDKHFQKTGRHGK